MSKIKAIHVEYTHRFGDMFPKRTVTECVYNDLEHYVKSAGYYFCDYGVADPQSIEKSTVHWAYYCPERHHYYMDDKGETPRVFLFYEDTDRMITPQEITTVKTKLRRTLVKSKFDKYDPNTFRRGPVPHSSRCYSSKWKPRSRPNKMNEVRWMSINQDILDEYDVKVRNPRNIDELLGDPWDDRRQRNVPERNWKKFRKTQWK